jgi:RNA polymerase sigma-70 factor (ECF subfamily)
MVGTVPDAPVRAALSRGDVTGAATLVLDAYARELKSYFQAVVRDDDASRELFVELGEQLMKSLPRFRGDSSVRTFVYAIAWNLVGQHRRKKRRDRRNEGLDEDDARLVAPGPRTPTANFRRTSAKLRLEEARARLTEEELGLLVLRVDRAMSWSEIGVVLGVGAAPADTAILRKRFERIVKRLRTWVAPAESDTASESSASHPRRATRPR